MVNINNKKLGIIVCADDFGISSQANDAIIKLLERKRISAVSCLVTGGAWNDGGTLLKNFQDAIDIGLHLSYRGLPFSKILLLICAGRMDRKIIFEEFKIQLNCFLEKFGRPPDFIDGHQYIHQLPVFKSALLDLANVLKGSMFYVRNSSMLLKDILRRKIAIPKSILISAAGKVFKKQLSERQINTNSDFLGIYDFNADKNAGEILELFIKNIKKPNSILVVHPGYGNKVYRNKCFEEKREEEMNYLISDKFKTTLEYFGLYPARFTSYRVML